MSSCSVEKTWARNYAYIPKYLIGSCHGSIDCRSSGSSRKLRMCCVFETQEGGCYSLSPPTGAHVPTFSRLFLLLLLLPLLLPSLAGCVV